MNSVVSVYHLQADDIAGVQSLYGAPPQPPTAPAITAHPTSRTVMAGASVAFTVSASGYPTPTIRWQKDGADIPDATAGTLTINPVNASDAGTYRAIATNGAGSATSDAATLTVTIPPAPPSIVVGVTSQTLDAGTTASFGVTAAGDAPLSYQWAFNGTDIPGATAATYSVGVSDATAGTYRVTVTNAVGSATSSGSLSVKPPPAAPTITSQPSDRTVNAGANASFTVGVAGYPSPTIQWQKDGTNIPGAFGATLNLTNVQPSAAGQYRVVVTNASGTATSTAATLTVTTEAPAITTQPVGQTTTVGSSFSFTVAASGLPAPTYQWRKDGVAIPGATAATYGKSSAALADAGSYDVVATNLVGTATSTAAALTVNPAPQAPTFTTQPTAQSAFVGGGAAFTVVAAGYPAPTLQWTKNGTAIPGATSATLSLTNVQYGDAANYAAIATNASGSVTSTVVALTVEAAPTAPVIMSNPSGGTVGLGTTLRLTVTATGNPTPTYQWRKDGAAITGATAATLTLSSIRLTDAGTYTVVVTNSQGSVTSANAVVAVQYPPSITKQPVALSVHQGAPASFTVEAKGHPAPTYQWKARGAVIPGATSATYTIASAQPADAGNYQVVVANASGSVTSESVALTITTGPSITTQPADVDVLAGANVDFSVATNGTPPITYQWYMNDVLAAGHTSAAFGSFKAEGYHDGTTFKVVVTNALGSTTSRTATLRVGVPAAPTITTQPADLIAAVGGGADFTVEASGVPTPTFQWYLNDTLVSGSTKANFGAFTVAAYHEGFTFKCVVTNASGSVTTRSAKLMVGVPTAPSITTQPADLLIPAGSNADFSVVAAGIPAPTYQWFLNGQPVEGRTQASYGAFKAEGYHDGFTFHCVVTNASGAVTTRTAKLKIAVPSAPAIVKQPANLTAQVGEPADFSVEATGYPTPTYQWYLNDTLVPGSTQANFGAFTVAAFHAGWTFKCVVTNANGSVTSQAATLAVGARPVITSQSQAVGVANGQTATLALTAPGATGFQWYKGGVAVTGGTGASLVLPAVGPAEAGIYDCTVTGAGGATLSAPVVLGVVPAAGQRTAGAVSTRTEWQNIKHPNGATYDQFLLTGNAGTFTADTGKIARMSYLDPQGSIVQVEMSGAGAITVVLDPATASGPKAPALYNQSGIEYMQGKATIILSGADASTHFTIYSVGTATNPGVTKPDVNYAGWADVAVSGIVSTDGGLGGIHQGNVNYNATTGQTGIYAPTVTNVPSLIVVHGIAAGGTALPYLQFGQGGNAAVKIAGTSLSQPSADALTVNGLAKVTMGAGQDSCGRAAPAQAIATRLLDPAGNDVTAAVVEGP